MDLRLLLFVFCSFFHLLLFSNGQMLAKSFQVTRTSDGTELCSVDPPSKAFNVSQLIGASAYLGIVPSKALCGWQCSKDPNCMSYNWRDDIGVCEVYYYDPVSCSVVSCCEFFQVNA